MIGQVDGMTIAGVMTRSRLEVELLTGIVAMLFMVASVAGPVGAEELRPKVGRGTAPPNARGNGPWATRVMLATSTNGLDFARLHFVLSDQAGVPSVVVDSEGRARVYYVDFGNGNILACAVQQNRASLTNWTYHRVRIAGAPVKGSDPVDPSAVVTDDKRIRLYYMQGRPRPTVFSAVSSNGIDFADEPGERFVGGASGMPEAVYDPCVLKLGAEWLLWCGPDGRFTAKSTDGLKFVDTGEFKVKGVSFMPWSAAALPGAKGYRLYGNFRGPGEWAGGVSSVFSPDGSTWNRETGVRLSLGKSKWALEDAVMPDNGCALLSNGTWLMAYVARMPEVRGKR